MYALVRIAIFALMAGPVAAPAQTFPSKPVRIVVGFAAGGASDVFARATAPKLSEFLSQPVIVDNRPGAGGNIGADNVAKSPPDGHSVLLAAINHYLTPFFTKSVPYDPQNDFIPIVMLANTSSILAVHPSLPAHSMRELIDYAKSNRAKLFYGSVGTGTTFHLAGIMLAQAAGIDLEHVPYKGGNPSINDALSGALPVVILSASTIMPHVRSGKLRALGVIEDRRSPAAPGVPAIGETVPGYAVPDTWFGILGPAGIPAPVVARLNAEFRKAVAAPEVRARLESLGFEVTGNRTAEEFAARVKTDVELVRKVVSAAGIKPE